MKGVLEAEDEEMNEKADDVDEQKAVEGETERERGDRDNQSGRVTWEKRMKEWRMFESAYPNLPLFSLKDHELSVGDRIGWMVSI